MRLCKCRRIREKHTESFILSLHLSRLTLRAG